MSKNISCIIPAHNEGSRIGGVLDIITQCPSLGEIIVIDDASTDNTIEVVSRYPGVTLLRHEKNLGKTKAVLNGMKTAKHDLVVAIDSDLIGLSVDAVEKLMRPVLDGEVDMTISLRKNALLVYKMLGIDFVSGERAFNKHLLLSKEAELNKIAHFGLEVFMNAEIIKNGVKLRVVEWGEVISPRKSVKTGFIKGSLGDLRMIGHIHKTVPLHKCVTQMLTLRKISRRHKHHK